jgi:hypothetical protein
VAITNSAAGERFAIDQTPAGVVYVIWKDTSGALQYAIATRPAATRFGAAQTLPTRGDVEFPELAVDAMGAGWATWTNASSPAHAFALPIIPAPLVTSIRLSDGGSVSLATPRACVAPGATFTATIGFQHSKRKRSVYVRISGVAFSVSGSPAKTVRHAPYRAALKLSASTRHGSKVTARARITITTRQGRPATKSIHAKVTVCA